MLRRAFCVCVLLMLNLSALLVPAAAQAPAVSAPMTTTGATLAPLRVLFVGDNLLGGMYLRFRHLAASGEPPLAVRSVDWVVGSQTLKDHLTTAGGSSVDEIRAGQWDVVVLEEDPNLEGPPDEFRASVRKFDAAVREGKARTVLFMPYAYREADEFHTDQIAALYAASALEIKAPVAPVALAYARSIRERPDLDLYSTGGDLDSAYGCYLKMCVLYATLFDRSPVGLTYRMEPDDGRLLHMGESWKLSDADAAFLQQVAWDTVMEYRQAPAAAAPAAKPVGRVLFVGDSGVADMDVDFPKLAASGNPPVAIESKAVWADLGLAEVGSAGPAAVRAGKWDVVVVYHNVLYHWPDAEKAAAVKSLQALRDAAQESGARLVLFMSNNYRGREKPSTADIAAWFEKVGADLGATLAPTALAYERAQRERPDVPLFAGGGYDTSPQASYLRLCVLYATLFDRSPVGLADRMAPLTAAQILAYHLPADWALSDADAAFLQKVAWDTVTEYRKAPTAAAAPAAPAGATRVMFVGNCRSWFLDKYFPKVSASAIHPSPSRPEQTSKGV